VIEWILAQPEWEWVVSPEILREYDEVLARPRFGLPKIQRMRWRELLARRTTLWRPLAPMSRLLRRSLELICDSHSTSNRLSSLPVARAGISRSQPTRSPWNHSLE